MKKKLFVALLSASIAAQAQVPSNAQFQIPFKKADAQLMFRYTDEGKPTPIEWGFDLAWLSEDNVRRGMAFSGKDIVDIMRVSYMPSGELVNDQLTSDMISYINKRANLVKKYCKEGVGVNINDDHATVDKWYNALLTNTRAERWARVIDLTAQKYRSLGLNIVSISPFNEPDYGWDQGLNSTTRKMDFLNIANLLRKNPLYEGVRICGGNTLNCDQAYSWWNYLKTGLDEGNTHQLAGDFNHYADFFQAVREYGHHATADELHNTMEAMVGVEYGMQTGIWWGTAEYARGQYMKATYQGNPGQRLGYAEHRDNWTSATVYRHAEGNVQAFIGSSERQAATTTYQFVSLDHDVFYQGQGPMRHFVAEIPGGTGYQVGQTNAETVFDIQSGEDVQPYINGAYRIANKYANTTGKGKYLGYTSNPGTNWKQLQQSAKATSDAKATFQQWIVEPVNPRIGGDYSYYDVRMVGNEKIRMDILNWSLSDGGQVGSFPGDLGNNEQWYLQYAGDGWFYIRSRHSNLALACVTTSAGSANVVQQNFKKDEPKQMWRFIPANAEFDRVNPAAPQNVVAIAQPASVLLKWDAVADEDLDSYDVLRAEKGSETWYTIGRGLTDTCFVDNTALDGVEYQYAIRAQDKCLNRSEKSEAVLAAANAEKALICHLDFENSLNDTTLNGNHAVMVDAAYSNKESYIHSGDCTLDLSKGTSFVQLPSTIASHDNLTISCWVRRATTASWERIFDFGNGTDQYIFLTPSNGSKMRLALKNGGEEQTLDCSILTSSLKHVAVTLDGDHGIAKIYVNGELKATKEDLTIKPSDIQSVCNYIGRSQFNSDPLFKGYIDDFRIYNYALSDEEIAEVYAPTVVDGMEEVSAQNPAQRTQTYDLNGRPASAKTQKTVLVSKNKKMVK